ncbi:MAG: GAF domain-containing protein [Candidatus Eremiobacteraeota bacterium]|nr:GAF domain-containing protein [Candidatus Eremiobacteraeota bacterium]
MSTPFPLQDRERSLQNDYESLAKQAKALLRDEPDLIANSANFASLIYNGVRDINWAGFYFLRGNDLVLGPFCGKPACSRIGMGEGVCGQAAVRRQTIAVDDVRAFEGHIACDPVSRSEIVVPLVRAEALIGVFDVDSTRLARFTAKDKVGIGNLVHDFVTMTYLQRL